MLTNMSSVQKQCMANVKLIENTCLKNQKN